MNLNEMTARELAAALKNREVSAIDVTENALERAERIGEQVGAFAHLTSDLARDQAANADRAIAAGDAPAFAGVPVPIKDLNQVAGQPWEAGSRVMAGNVAQGNDAIVDLLASAGTVCIGKTTTPEFGFPPYTEPVAGPKARSPWDTTRTAGGSSGGAAAAVAAGIVPVAHASDGGGSIRIPASATGLVGHKPSRGLVSAAPGADGPGLNTNGVVTRDVRDSAAFLDVLSRYQPGDPWLRKRPETTYVDACDRDPGALRVGLLWEPLNVEEIDLHPHSREAVELTARKLESLGHHVEIAPRPMNSADWETFMPLWATTAAQLPVPEEAVEMLEPLTRWLREMGEQFTAVDFANAVAGMHTLTRKVVNAWSDFDVILTPALPPGTLRPEDLMREDPAEDFYSQRRFTPWTSVWNMLGAPSIALPVHAGKVGPEWPNGEPLDDANGVLLPFSIMLGAVHIGADETLFGLAAQLEEALPWRERQLEVIRRFA